MMVCILPRKACVYIAVEESYTFVGQFSVPRHVKYEVVRDRQAGGGNKNLKLPCLYGNFHMFPHSLHDKRSHVEMV